MEISTKKYKGNALRAYKVLMRKLSADGFYQELRAKEYFRSKAELRREAESKGKIRAKKKQAKIMQKLEAESNFKQRPKSPKKLK